MRYIWLLLFITSGAFAADKNVTCSGTTCTGDAPSKIDKPYWTALDFGDNADHISVTVPAGQAPRSMRMNVRNGDFPGKNLIVDLSSTKDTENAGNAVVIGDYFNNLTMKLNGFNGTSGSDASQLCADKMKAGVYGTDARDYFNQRRDADSTLSRTRCDRSDLSYLQNYAFSCDDASFTKAVGTNPIVEVSRIQKKAQCQGVLVQDLCVWRTVDARCGWRGRQQVCWSSSKGKSSGCRYDLNGDVRYLYVRMREDIFNSKLNQLGWVGFCNANTTKPTPSGGSATSYYEVQASDSAVSLSPLQIDPNTYQPVAGSDWVTYYTRAYGSCLAGSVYIKTFYRTAVAYDNTGTDCRKEDIIFADDPYKVIPWTYVGMAQEPSFGTETVQCSLSDCPIQFSLSDLERNLDVITPGSGTNGTQQGYGLAFVYDINAGTNNPLTQAIVGQAGAAGRADLDSPEEVRFCYKKRDSETDGITSEYARNPTVNFRRYRWKSIKVGSGGNSGSQPQNSGNTIEVYKKIDSSVRFLLSKEIL